MDNINMIGRKWWIALIRVILSVVVFVWGWYIASAFRTQHFGFTPEIFAVTGMFVLPVALLPFLGLRRWLVGGGVLTLLFAVVVAVEALAVAEEARFQEECRAKAPDGRVVKNRSWPFDNHFVSYDPIAGTWGGGD